MTVSNNGKNGDKVAGGVVAKLRNEAMTKDIIDPFQEKAKEWGCAVTTVERARTDLIHEGIILRPRKANSRIKGYLGHWLVVQRPELITAESVFAPVPEQPELPALVPELAPEQPSDTSVLIGLLREIRDDLRKFYELWM